MKKLVLAAFCVLFAACGGSSGSSDGSGQEATVSGVVIYSAFSPSDRVCFDRNRNKRCDTEEPEAHITSGGTYIIAGTNADFASVPLIAELSNTFSGTGSLSAAGAAPSLVFETPAGERIISSLTTVIKAKMDNNPLLSVSAAHEEVRTDLNTQADLFSASSTAVNLAEEITAVIKAMFEDLSMRFGITVSDKVIMLVMNEIIPQLSFIASGKAPEQVVSDTIGGKIENDIISEMNDLENSKPVIMTAVDVFQHGLEAYDFGYDKNGMPNNLYGFSFFDFSNTALRVYTNGAYLSALPDTTTQNIDNYIIFGNSDGSVTMSSNNNETIKLVSIEKIPMDGKIVSSSPRHGGKAITLSPGAVVYKIKSVDDTPFPGVSYIRNNCGDLNFACGGVTLNNNIVEIRWTSVDESYDIVMNADETYEVKANNVDSSYNKHNVFSPKDTPPKGRYEKTSDSYGDVYIFKNIDGNTAFIVFKMNASSYYIAGEFREYGSITNIWFNRTAAEDIKNQW